MLGEENKGFKLAMMTLDRTRPGVAAMATGIARAAFEFATEYSKERVQFGVPIAMHQAIQFMIADMATKVHLSRLAAWHSAVLLDQGKRNTLESSHAKRYAADSAMEVTTDAVQVYGGYGFIKDYPVEKLMRDAKIMQLYEGTSQIQRLVIAREVLLPRQAEKPTGKRKLKMAHTTIDTSRRHTAAAPSNGSVGTAEGKPDVSTAAHQAFWLLRITFTIAPILFGVDKFVNWSVHWPDYLAHWVNNIVPGSGQDMMYVVGGIEIAADDVHHVLAATRDDVDPVGEIVGPEHAPVDELVDAEE